jgi:hypothetical protein
MHFLTNKLYSPTGYLLNVLGHHVFGDVVNVSVPAAAGLFALGYCLGLELAHWMLGRAINRWVLSAAVNDENKQLLMKMAV